MANRQALARAVAKFPGATFTAERVGHAFDVRIMAPPGHHWGQGQDVHEMVTGSNYGPAEWQAQTYRDAIQRLETTTPEPCTPDTCQVWVDGACEWWAE